MAVESESVDKILKWQFKMKLLEKFSLVALFVSHFLQITNFRQFINSALRKVKRQRIDHMHCGQYSCNQNVLYHHPKLLFRLNKYRKKTIIKLLVLCKAARCPIP